MASSRISTPAVGYSFGLEIDGIEIKQIQEVDRA